MVRGIKITTLALLWLAPLLILSEAFASDWVSVWDTFRVPAMKPPFLDLHAITDGVKTLKQGGDPLISNPSDPLRRRLPYPRIWVHLFSWLGIRESHIAIIGIAFCVLYLICISWLIVRCESGVGAVILLIAGLSVAPLFAIERANIDLFIFFLVFLGCAVTNKFQKSGAFFLAAMLKIYPLAAMAVDAIRRPFKANVVPIAAMLTGGALWTWQWRELAAIRQAAPVPEFLAFGVAVLRAQAAYMNWKFFGVCCAAAAVIVIIAWSIRPNLDGALLDSKFGEMFLVFGGIYVFTFAAGANFNYRLIFLLPTLPLAIELVRTPQNRGWGIMYIGAVLIAENSSARGLYQATSLGDMATWAIFVALLIILLQHASDQFFARRESSAPPKQPANSAA